MKFTATIQIILEVPIESSSLDEAWTEAEAIIADRVAEAAADAVDGSRVYRVVVDEVE